VVCGKGIPIGIKSTKSAKGKRGKGVPSCLSGFVPNNGVVNEKDNKLINFSERGIRQ
jgi:hypothetical protein